MCFFASCLKKRFYLNIFKLKNPFHRKLLIFYIHIQIFAAAALLALLCFAAIACFTSLKMIQQNKKLIESQTKKKLFIISLSLSHTVFWGGNFFLAPISEFCKKICIWKKLFVRLEAEFISNLNWTSKVHNKKISPWKLFWRFFNLKIRVFNNWVLGEAYTNVEKAQKTWSCERNEGCRLISQISSFS